MIENITNFDFSELNKFDKIFCLVSGGIDSTLLLEYCYQFCDNSKVIPVNCYNVFEHNKTLTQIENNDNKFIKILPNEKYDLNEVMKNAFLNINKAIEIRKGNILTKKGKKSNNIKHYFQCCKIIKHKAFLEEKMFKEKNSVIISGIKLHDGFQRYMWLNALKTGKNAPNGVIIENYPTFYHLHKGGQLYCYPFRDYLTQDFPTGILNQLKEKYPTLNHSGCTICPILVVYEDRIRQKAIKHNDTLTLERLDRSLRYYNKLNIIT